MSFHRHPGAREDFDELCKHGCNPQVLAPSRTAKFPSPRSHLGNDGQTTETRQKAIQSLEKAVGTLEEIFGVLIAVEDERTERNSPRSDESVLAHGLRASLLWSAHKHGRTARHRHRGTFARKGCTVHLTLTSTGRPEDLTTNTYRA